MTRQYIKTESIQKIATISIEDRNEPLQHALYKFCMTIGYDFHDCIEAIQTLAEGDIDLKGRRFDPLEHEYEIRKYFELITVNHS